MGYWWDLHPRPYGSQSYALLLSYNNPKKKKNLQLFCKVFPWLRKKKKILLFSKYLNNSTNTH